MYSFTSEATILLRNLFSACLLELPRFSFRSKPSINSIFSYECCRLLCFLTVLTSFWEAATVVPENSFIAGKVGFAGVTKSCVLLMPFASFIALYAEYWRRLRNAPELRHPIKDYNLRGLLRFYLGVLYNKMLFLDQFCELFDESKYAYCRFFFQVWPQEFGSRPSKSGFVVLSNSIFCFTFILDCALQLDVHSQHQIYVRSFRSTKARINYTKYPYRSTTPFKNYIKCSYKSTTSLAADQQLSFAVNNGDDVPLQSYYINYE